MASKLGLDDQFRQCRQATDKHLQALKVEIDSVIDEALEADKDKEQKAAAKIKPDINQKYEDREKQLEVDHTRAEKRQEHLSDKRLMFHADIKNIAKEIERKIDELEESRKEDKKTPKSKHTTETLRQILQDKVDKVKNWDRESDTAVTDELEKQIEQITRTVRDVRFVKGAGKETFNGRIDGYDGEWKLLYKIFTKGTLRDPTIVGCIGDRNIIVRYGELGTYTLDIKTGRTQGVITSAHLSGVTSCALLNDDKVVCGKYNKDCTVCKCKTCDDSLTGFVSVYDQGPWRDNQWKPINDINLPDKTGKTEPTSVDHEGTPSWVDVDVDQCGMIIAGEVKWSVIGETGKSKIYVINPTDGKIINTITCKEDAMLGGVLSTGYIVARPLPPDRRVLINNRNGAQKKVTHCDIILNVCVDHLTDDLYVVTTNEGHKMCVIDQVMSGGDLRKRRVGLFPISTSCLGRIDRRTGVYFSKSEDYRRCHLIESRVVMTSSGKMVASDGEHILVFKKLLSL